VPSNATLAIAGDFDPATVKQLVEKWFGGLPVSQKPKTLVVPPPPPKATTVTVEDSFARLRQVTFAWHTPALFADGDAELDVAADALSADGRGRLYKTLVYDKQLAQSVSASQQSTQFSSLFTITVTLRTGADLEQVTKLVMDEVSRLAKESVTDKELQRFVVDTESNVIWGLERLNARADALQNYNHFLGDPGKLTYDLDRYRKTTPDKIRAAFAKYIVPQQAVSIITNPVGGAK